MERRQSFIDVAIATTGSAESVFEAAAANGVGITAAVPAGVVGGGVVMDAEVVEVLRGAVPACGAPHRGRREGGIGYDIIGKTAI